MSLRIIVLILLATGCRHYNKKFEQEESQTAAPKKDDCKVIWSLEGEPLDRQALLDQNICEPLRLALESNLLLSMSPDRKFADVPNHQPLTNMASIDVLCDGPDCQGQQIRFNEVSLGTLDSLSDKQAPGYLVLLSKLSTLSSNQDVALRVDHRVPATVGAGVAKLLGVRLSHVWLIGPRRMLPGGVRAIRESSAGIATGTKVALNTTDEPVFEPWQTWGDGVLPEVWKAGAILRANGGELLGPRVVLRGQRLTLGGEVAFAPGQAQLSAEAKPLLAEAAKVIGQIPGLSRVQIMVRAPEGASAGLGKDRAAAIRTFLIGQGVSAPLLVASNEAPGKGQAAVTMLVTTK